MTNIVSLINDKRVRDWFYQIALLLGLAALIGGMQLSIFVSVIGFVVMLVSTVVALSSWRVVETQAQSRGQAPDSALTDLDDRWRRDEGF